MNTLLKSVTIVDKTSDFHNSKVDILIENGIISNIDFNIINPKNYKEISEIKTICLFIVCCGCS